VGAAEVEVVHDPRLEEAAGMPGRVKDDGAATSTWRMEVSHQ
jgi:hypothetical protein